MQTCVPFCSVRWHATHSKSRPAHRLLLCPPPVHTALAGGVEAHLSSTCMVATSAVAEVAEERLAVHKAQQLQQLPRQVLHVVLVDSVHWNKLLAVPACRRRASAPKRFGKGRRPGGAAGAHPALSLWLPCGLSQTDDEEEQQGAAAVELARDGHRLRSEPRQTEANRVS
eukprot:366239-Chlamydomonas_euryale.AAC.39